MRYLIDTQILIWSFGQTEKLSAKVSNIIENQDNQLFVSIASLWEMAIKINLGKLKLPVDYRFLLRKS